MHRHIQAHADARVCTATTGPDSPATDSGEYADSFLSHGNRKFATCTQNGVKGINFCGSLQ